MKIILIDIPSNSKYALVTKRQAELFSNANPTRYALPEKAKEFFLSKVEDAEHKQNIINLMDLAIQYNKEVLAGGNPTTKAFDRALNGETEVVEVVKELEKVEVQLSTPVIAPVVGVTQQPQMEAKIEEKTDGVIITPVKKTRKKRTRKE